MLVDPLIIFLFVHTAFEYKQLSNISHNDMVCMRRQLVNDQKTYLHLEAGVCCSVKCQVWEPEIKHMEIFSIIIIIATQVRTELLRYRLTLFTKITRLYLNCVSFHQAVQ